MLPRHVDEDETGAGDAPAVTEVSPGARAVTTVGGARLAGARRVAVLGRWALGHAVRTVLGVGARVALRIQLNKLTFSE